MTTTNDPLQASQDTPVRVAYAVGVLLDADAFTAEQTYHRARLARALASLHGSGTVVGMRVEYQPRTDPQPDGSGGNDEQLMVHPGLAIDRLGRMIELPRAACIRLDPWYAWLAANTPGDLIQGLHGAPYNGVVADVFVRFTVCEQGKTPAFLTGQFDALDGVAPSRLRDAYELQLVIRKEESPALPQRPWPDFSQGADLPSRLTAMHTSLLDAWPNGTNGDGPGTLPPLVEHTENQDPTFLFLARTVLPATAGANGGPPARTAGAVVSVDNDSRAFVYPVGALASWLGVSL